MGKTIKVSLYPKTTRFNENETYFITEKIDGSNLIIINTIDGLYIAQRNLIWKFKDIIEEDFNDIVFNGLYQWIKNNENNLSQMYINTCICGEWVVKDSKIKYGENGFFIFAKGKYDFERKVLINLDYTTESFSKIFKNGLLPKNIILPKIIVEKINKKNLTISKLDNVYDDYLKKVNREVEGFIIVSSKNNVEKYVRFKNGCLENHKE
ncbi:MAG: RNA ligase family protein [Mycoplasma sp.]